MPSNQRLIILIQQKHMDVPERVLGKSIQDPKEFKIISKFPNQINKKLDIKFIKYLG